MAGALETKPTFSRLELGKRCLANTRQPKPIGETMPREISFTDLRFAIENEKQNDCDWSRMIEDEIESYLSHPSSDTTIIYHTADNTEVL